jgi:hypothetical protein
MRVSCNGQQWDWSKLQIKTIMFVFWESDPSKS